MISESRPDWRHRPSAIAALALLLAGCSGREPHAAAEASAAASAPAAAAQPFDRWLGRWNGPEGTFLELTGGKGKYGVRIRNLDGPRSFAGIAAGGGIEFERDGSKEMIRATNGAATGMKWLDGKSDCLTVRPGEGYCRD